MASFQKTSRLGCAPQAHGIAGLTTTFNDAFQLLADGDIAGALVSPDGRMPGLRLSRAAAYDLLLGRDGNVWRSNDGSWFGHAPSSMVAEASPSAGIASSTVIAADGSLWRWGNNDKGQLGDGTTDDREDAAAVPALRLFDDEWLTEDADGDNLSNLVEYYYGTDPLLADSNGDGILDGSAIAIGRDAVSVDLDGDGVSNQSELGQGTDPLRTDTDGDGVADGMDFYPLDSSRSEPEEPVPGDVTPPDITLTSPSNAVLISTVPE